MPGGIQTLYLHNGPLRGPGLSLFQRIMFLPLSWLVQYLVRFAILIIPIIYLWFGLLPLYFTNAADYISNQVPLLTAYFLLMLWITPTRYLPVVSSAVGAFATFRMLPTVISSVVRPFGKPFRVTPKGSGNEAIGYDGYSLAWIAVLILATAIGLVINIMCLRPPMSRRSSHRLRLAGRASTLSFSLSRPLICFEKPRRLFDAFKLDEAVHVDGVPGRMVSLALDKAVVAVPPETRLHPPMSRWSLEGSSPFKTEWDGHPKTKEALLAWATRRPSTCTSISILAVFGPR